MSYQDIRNTREGFVNADAGDKIVKFESRILGIVSFFALLIKGESFVFSLIVGILIFGVFPYLIGLVSVFGWIAAILFSGIWAFVGYFVIGALTNNNIGAGVVAAIIVFIISFFLHKIFSGLNFVSVEKRKIDVLDSINNGVNPSPLQKPNPLQKVKAMVDEFKEGYNATKAVGDDATQSQNMNQSPAVKYCAKCGVKLEINDSFCKGCGAPQKGE